MYRRFFGLIKATWVPNNKPNVLEIPHKPNLIKSGSPINYISMAKSYWFWVEHSGARYDLWNIWNDSWNDKTTRHQLRLFEVSIQCRLRMNSLYCSIPALDVCAAFIVWTLSFLSDNSLAMVGTATKGLMCDVCFGSLHSHRAIWWLTTLLMHAGIFNIYFINMAES